MIADPILIPRCPEPPTSTPLTIAGLPVVFSPDMRDYDSWGGNPGNPLVAIRDQGFNVEDSQYPTFEQVKSAFARLCQDYPDIIRLSYHYTHWIVTLRSSGFDADVYPGKLANRTILYTWPRRFKSHSLATPSFLPSRRGRDGLSGVWLDPRSQSRRLR